MGNNLAVIIIGKTYFDGKNDRWVYALRR